MAPALVLVLAMLGCSSNHDGDTPPEILEGSIHTLSDADDLFFSDALGSLGEQTSGTGTPRGSFASFPFGVARYDTTGETRKYANSPRDNGVGLDQMGARSYAPDLGVWTSADPIALGHPERAIGEPFAAANVYAYASNMSELIFGQDHFAAHQRTAVLEDSRRARVSAHAIASRTRWTLRNSNGR